jgi:Mrp family chromosome partitioning ATPase
MSQIFKAMYQVPDLGTRIEDREAAWRRTLEVLRNPEQEEELLQPTIPPTNQISTSSFQVPYQARRSQQALAGTATPAAPGTQRHSAFLRDESFQLVRRLFLTAGDKAPRAVVFCAVEGGNAHSLISARVAELLAWHTHSSVCIVDANLADPSLHAYFGVENGEGLAEGILERSSVQGFARSVGPNGLRLISAGALPLEVDSNALVTSGRFDAWISELRAGFRYVVVNAPPVPGNCVTSCLAALTDGVILVVQPSFTPREAARQAKEDIEAAGGRLLGVVLWRRALLSLNRSGSSRKGRSLTRTPECQP